MREPEPMREIHAIQEALYEEEKHLSPQERMQKIHQEAQEVIQKYGLKLIKYRETKAA